MAYIQTTNRLIHVKEDLTKLKNRLFLFYGNMPECAELKNTDFITVTEVIPEIDINEKCKDEFYGQNSWRDNTIEKMESMWNKEKKRLTKQNEKLSKGIKILIRVSDIMELHDEKR